MDHGITGVDERQRTNASRPIISTRSRMPFASVKTLAMTTSVLREATSRARSFRPDDPFPTATYRLRGSARYGELTESTLAFNRRFRPDGAPFVREVAAKYDVVSGVCG